jgi:hypothetical protein
MKVSLCASRGFSRAVYLGPTFSFDAGDKHGVTSAFRKATLAAAIGSVPASLDRERTRGPATAQLPRYFRAQIWLHAGLAQTGSGAAPALLPICD